MEVRIKLDLSKYRDDELLELVKQKVITQEVMKKELVSRGWDEVRALLESRKASA